MADHSTGTDPRALEVRGDESLERLVRELLQRAYEQRVWLVFLDARGRLKDPVFPVEGLPRDARARAGDPELGDVTHAELLARRAARVATRVSAAAVIIVWERPGRHRVGGALREWIRGVAAAAEGAGLPLRAQVVLSSSGARVVRPDQPGS
ncbi:hypothetical protein [Microbacterium sp. Marseille-Q6965]|uniref:hypothetical protein n=1 Tax=Microbacterium sp. Marseille-Q6965 TaxID=2965072 RepID=UPI0021B6EC49|nr:hypothetical protein [Microbacterium sp. Marseille-Q6965]